MPFWKICVERATVSLSLMMVVPSVGRGPKDCLQDHHHSNQVYTHYMCRDTVFAFRCSGYTHACFNKLFLTGFQNLVRTGSKKLRNSLRRHSMLRKEDQATHNTSVSSFDNLISSVSACNVCQWPSSFFSLLPL